MDFMTGLALIALVIVLWNFIIGPIIKRFRK